MEQWLGVAGQKRGRDAMGAGGSSATKTRASADAAASRFVQCPGCDRCVPLHRLEQHLDHECSSSGAAQAAGGDGSRGGSKRRLADPTVAPLLGPGAAAQRSVGVQITKYCRETRSKIAISLAQLREEVPCDLLLNYLDDATAEHVLASLMDASREWKQHTWWMFDKAYQTPRLATVYPFADFAGDADSMKLDIGLVDLPRLCTETLRDVAQRVEHTVNSHLQLRPAPEDDPTLRYRILPLPGMQVGGVKDRRWEATYALCNLYRDHNDCVGGHSDRMSSLGPLPIIAALSLGAARRFKFNKTGQGKHQGNSYSVQVPHNSLLVMWPPCQEQWTHEVPRVQAGAIQPHPTAGLTRVSVTFRQFRAEYHDYTPECACKHKCILKASTRPGPNYQRYYYACDTASESKPCGFFQWADWCVPKETASAASSSPTPSSTAI